MLNYDSKSLYEMIADSSRTISHPAISPKP